MGRGMLSECFTMPHTSSADVQTSPLDEVVRPPTFNILQPEVMSPRPKGLCSALFESSNGKCIMLSCAIYGSLGLTIWCQVGQDEEKDKYSSDSWITSQFESDSKCQTYLLVPIIFAVLFYISYLLENWQYYTRQEDLITISIPSTIGWIERMKHALPMVWWKASCYHYTTFPCRPVGPAGTNRPTSSSTYQRVISHTGASRYNYLTHGFRDVSSVITGLDESALTRIHFAKSFVFFTSTAAKEFEEQRKSFFRDHQTRDDYMEMREGMDLMDIDFPEQVIVVRDLDRVPWWRRKTTFILSVLCLQAAPLRVLLALKTATLRYNVLKVFGMDERESNWYGVPSVLLPAAESEMPPSYSEIMLQTVAGRPCRHFGRLLLQKTGTLVKSATFGLSGLAKDRMESFELSEGIKARGFSREGYTPVSPTAEEREVRDVSEVLRKNGPKMFAARFMKKSNTAPAFSGAPPERAVSEGEPGSAKQKSQYCVI